MLMNSGDEFLAKDSEEQKQQETYVDVGDKTVAWKVGCKISHFIKCRNFV